VHASGMAWADGVLWIGDYKNKKIHKVDPQTGTVLKTLNSERLVTGVCWVDGELWHGAFDEALLDPERGSALKDPDGPRSCEVRRVDPETGTVLAGLHIDGWYCSGLEADTEGRFWCGGSSEGRVRAIRRPGQHDHVRMPLQHAIERAAHRPVVRVVAPAADEDAEAGDGVHEPPWIRA